MSGFTRVLLGILLAAALLFGAGFLLRKSTAGQLFQRAIERNVGRDSSANLSEGLHVYVCGAGSPLPDPKRAGPCLAVVAGDQHLIIDAGSGGVRNLTRMGFPVGKADAIFVTHLHSDHIDGLGELLMQAWVNGGRDTPMPVYGPLGTSDLVAGFNLAYAADAAFRTAHHGADIANPDGKGGLAKIITLPAPPAARAVVYSEGGLTVTAFAVDHSPVEPAFGYRVDYQGRSVSISGDTVYNTNLVEASRGADILFHEALNKEMVAAMQEVAREKGREDLAKILGDIPGYHASPVDAARAASEAGVSRLVYYHSVPPLPLRSLNALFLENADAAFSGPIEIAEDGLIYSLPAGSSAIEVKREF
jgi:ribonuclease Z